MRTIRPDREAQIRAATEALVAVLLAAVEDAEPARDLPDELWSVDRAAAALGLGRSLVYELISAGKLRSLTVGRRRLVPSTAVTEFVAARASDAAVAV